MHGGQQRNAKLKLRGKHLNEKTFNEALGLREAKAYWLEHFIFKLLLKLYCLRAL
jgi:hypothetical protein